MEAFCCAQMGVAVPPDWMMELACWTAGPAEFSAVCAAPGSFGFESASIPEMPSPPRRSKFLGLDSQLMMPLSPPRLGMASAAPVPTSDNSGLKLLMSEGKLDNPPPATDGIPPPVSIPRELARSEDKPL